MDQSPVLTMWKNQQSLAEGAWCSAATDDLDRWLLCYTLTLADTDSVSFKLNSPPRIEH